MYIAGFITLAMRKHGFESSQLVHRTDLMRLLLSAGVSSFDADASDSGVEERVLLGKLAKLFNGTRAVIDAGGVSSLLPGSDLTGVLEKCSKLDRTSVCCNEQ